MYVQILKWLLIRCRNVAKCYLINTQCPLRFQTTFISCIGLLCYIETHTHCQASLQDKYLVNNPSWGDYWNRKTFSMWFRDLLLLKSVPCIICKPLSKQTGRLYLEISHWTSTAVMPAPLVQQKKGHRLQQWRELFVILWNCMQEVFCCRSNDHKKC